MTTMNQIRASNGRPFRRVWIKAFWGFDPENEGFLGFTRKGDRARLFAQYQAGDLILIYGTRGSRTAKAVKDRLKAHFAKRFTSLGGEFFLGALQDAGKQFLKQAAG